MKIKIDVRALSELERSLNETNENLIKDNCMDDNGKIEAKSTYAYNYGILNYAIRSFLQENKF